VSKRPAKKSKAPRPQASVWPDALHIYFNARGIPIEWAEAGGCTYVSEEVAKGIAGRTAHGRPAIGFTFRGLDGQALDFKKLNFAGQEPVDITPTEDEKHALKSWQQGGRAPPLFLAPPPPGDKRMWREIANDTRVPLLFTESEVKALAGALNGHWTVGATSCETWHEAGDPERLVEVFRDINVNGRRVFIALDSDAATNPNVGAAEDKLKRVLKRRGAEAVVVRLPAPTDGRKSLGLDDFLVEQGADAFRKLVDAVPALPDSLDSGDTLLDTKHPPLLFAINPYLPKREVVELHGAHGQFKSWLALAACLSVATGEAWGACDEVQKGTAAFISLEDRTSTLQRRVQSWIAGVPKFNATSKDPKKLEAKVRANFACLGRERAAPLALTENVYNQPQIRRAAVECFVKLCTGRDLVVLETASRLNPAGETNDALSMFALALEEIVERSGTCVVLIRHVAKETALTGNVSSYGGRGGGALADAARSVLSVQRKGTHPLDPVTLVHTKATHTAKGCDLHFKPLAAGGEVFLRAATAPELIAASENHVLDAIALAGPQGVKQRDLKRSLTGGKGKEGQAAQLQATIDALVAAGRVERVQLKGSSGPAATVLRVPGVAEVES
jgi:hypothetical protein